MSPWKDSAGHVRQKGEAAGVGVRIRAARVALEMPMRELGRIVGMEQHTVSRLEQGRLVRCSPAQWVLMADALGVTLDELFREPGTGHG